MHRCLNILDIQERIFENLDSPDLGRTLAAVAQTCQAFTGYPSSLIC